jgi:SAM-dependent methyltransferase
LYHELAWAYDPVSLLVSGGRWSAWCRAAVPFVVGARVLDVGCGTGRFLVDLCQRDLDATAVELSRAMLRRATANLARAGYPGRLVGADARRLPFPSETFDSATVTFPTPVIRDQSFWIQLGRVLRPGGKVVVVLGARTGRVGDSRIVDLAARLTGRSVGAADPPSLAHRALAELNLPVPMELFAVQVVDLEVERSLVTLVIATKAPEPP